MWRLFFEVCDFMVGFIPSKETRERIRREKLYDYRKKYNALRKKMMFVSSPQILEVEVQNRVGKKKTKRVYYGFYNVSGDK